MGRDWNRSSVDWSLYESPPETSAESQVYIDGGWDALRTYRKERTVPHGAEHICPLCYHPYDDGDTCSHCKQAVAKDSD